jgi:hypothetical protein
MHSTTTRKEHTMKAIATNTYFRIAVILTGFIPLAAALGWGGTAAKPTSTVVRERRSMKLAPFVTVARILALAAVVLAVAAAVGTAYRGG